MAMERRDCSVSSVGASFVEHSYPIPPLDKHYSSDTLQHPGVANTMLERRGSEPFVEQTFLLQIPNHGTDMLKELNCFREQGFLTDVILCIGGVELPCHRNVLAVSSPYFKAMFSSDLRESKEIRISFSDISPKIMEQMIDFAYTGRLEITVDNAQELLAGATLFQYPTIVKACCDFLSKQLHPSNCLGIEHFAQLHSCFSLGAEAHKYALDNFSAVVEYDEFLDMPLERLKHYLSSDLIDVRTEETVYDAAMRWVYSQVEHRQDYLFEVLQQVRLAIIDTLYLEQVVEQDSLIQSCHQSLELVIRAKKYLLTASNQGPRRRSMQPETITPRPSTVAKEVIVCIGGISRMEYVLQSVEMYDPNKDKWSLLPDLPQPISCFSATAVANDIYVTGGVKDGRIMTSVWRFDSRKRQWFEEIAMLEPRANHASAEWNDNLYVLGGVGCIDDSKVKLVENIECYNLETQAWTVVGSTPLPRKASHVVPFNQTLIEIGGRQNDTTVKSLESYLCSESGVRYSGEQFILPESIEFAKIMVLNSVFYIIWEDTKKCIVLDPKRRTFRCLPNMQCSHISGGVAMVNEKIYMCGGGGPSRGAERTAEYFDPDLNCWKIVKSMSQARTCMGCVTIQMT